MYMMSLYVCLDLFVWCVVCVCCVCVCVVFFFQAEDGIRDLVRSRGLGDVYKRQGLTVPCRRAPATPRATGSDAGPLDFRFAIGLRGRFGRGDGRPPRSGPCLLYTSDAADERSSVDLGGRRIIQNTTREATSALRSRQDNTQ